MGQLSAFAGKFDFESGKLGRFADVTFDQIEGGFIITDDLVTITLSVAFVTVVIFIEEIATGAMRFHDERTIFQGRLIVVAGKVIFFYNFGHERSFLRRCVLAHLHIQVALGDFKWIF
jgi:uncharacterized membrane protein YhaH (DUF805 family)